MTAPTQIVILGASGDLTLKKLMPALTRLAAAGRPSDGFHVIGVARRPLTDEAFRAQIRALLPDDLHAAFDAFAPRIGYQAADVSDPVAMKALEARLDALPGGAQAGRLFYLALKPELFGPTVQELSASGLVTMRVGEMPAFRRVVIEKPFGHDLASAKALNSQMHGLLREDQIYRIDHYLGKETVQNLLGFRFHNAIFEPLWNRHHVELVQITVAEDIGVELGRAGYYDTTGALRDMLQNHMLQVLSLVAMEPPVSLDPEAIRDQKVNLLRALHAPDPAEVATNSVRARYVAGQVNGVAVPGYRAEEGVPPRSDTETYVAIRAEIDTWRWHGVPFLLRHGKRLEKRFTEVKVQFRMPPLQLFNRPEGMAPNDFRRALHDGSLCQIRPNVLTLSIQPREAITLAFGVKRPGAEMVMAPAAMAFDYRDAFDAPSAAAYERLLLDAIRGDATLFLRADEIEASWRFADEVLGGWAQGRAPLGEYAAGSWGPEAADDLFHGCEGGWSRG
ncbi:MAG: glucose-6-phosphate dehydrogenase [Deltaproteobacteria bacterium]|nr:glucose-6-phosphate dehydrogenase [Deltaproteobacteria bacterium]